MSLGDILFPSYFRHRPRRLKLGSRTALPFQKVDAPDRRALRIEVIDGVPVPRVGDHFAAGARLGSLGSAQVLAPFNGTVAEVRSVPYLHGGLAALAVVLDRDAEADPVEKLEKLSDDAPRSAVLERLDVLGVCALGLEPKPLTYFLGDDAAGAAPATVVINAADEEPLLASQGQLLRDRSRDIAATVSVVRRASGAQEVLVAALASQITIAKAAGIDKILPVQERYPEALDEVVGRYALAAGAEAPVVVISLESAIAAQRAVLNGELTKERYFTVVGADLSAHNVVAEAGTSVDDILAQLGLAIEASDSIVFGGPMRGRSQLLSDASVDVTTDGLMIVASGDDARASGDPCISCGSCIEVCPSHLQPNWLGRNAEFGFFDQNEDVEHCIQCGLCAYMCPSGRPLLQWIDLTISERAKTQSAEGEE